MTAISWTVVDPDTIERMVAVGLCRRHRQARRIKPSVGDGGLDVLVPLPGGSQLQVENYQVKKFADGLNASRQRQIKKSLKSAIATHNGEDFGYTITRWYLALPMDLTREQEQWLVDLADDLEAPFPVSVFGLTSIEELLSESPDIREYYLGDGLERVREVLVQMGSLTGLSGVPADPLRLQPADASARLGDLHTQINAADPHFNYDYEVTTDLPVVTPGPGLIASVVTRTGPEAPHVTWHISVKYDAALEDRPVPGTFTVHPERMSDEQRGAWERWRDYGVPVVLEGDVVEDLRMDLPGGFGDPLPVGESLMRIGPAIGDFDDEPTTRSLWVIEDATGTPLAERLFSFRLQGRGIAGGEYRQGMDADGYITVDLYAIRDGDTTGSMTANLSIPSERWVAEPVQRILPMLRFVAAWRRGNRLRPQDEFGFTVASQAFELQEDPLVPAALVAAVEDLDRISRATRRPIGLPPNITALATQRGIGLSIIADAVSGVESELGVGELVLWYEDDPSAYADLAARAEAGDLVVPWRIPFPLLGEDFVFDFSLEVSGDVMLEPAEPNPAEPTRKAVRVVPTETTRGHLRWDPAAASSLG